MKVPTCTATRGTPNRNSARALGQDTWSPTRRMKYATKPPPITRFVSSVLSRTALAPRPSTTRKYTLSTTCNSNRPTLAATKPIAAPDTWRYANGTTVAQLSARLTAAIRSKPASPAPPNTRPAMNGAAPYATTPAAQYDVSITTNAD